MHWYNSIAVRPQRADQRRPLDALPLRDQRQCTHFAEDRVRVRPPSPHSDSNSGARGPHSGQQTHPMAHALPIPPCHRARLREGPQREARRARHGPAHGAPVMAPFSASFFASYSGTTTSAQSPLGMRNDPARSALSSRCVRTVSRFLDDCRQAVPPPCAPSTGHAASSLATHNTRFASCDISHATQPPSLSLTCRHGAQLGVHSLPF
jgi:hypothetical protein